MRRIVFVLITAVALLSSASPAKADWGCGYGGWSPGWGCGYGGWSSGWCGSGVGISVGYRPYYRSWRGCYPAYDCYDPCYGYDYGYGYGVGYYGVYSPYGVYYNPAANFAAYSLPPYHEPAELTYGPLAVKQFLGLDRNFAMGPLRERPARLPLVGDELLAERVIAERPIARERIIDRGTIRVSSAEQRRRAEQYIALGDDLFRQQKFHSALQRYKSATQAAPDMAEAFWRQGHAMIATSNFDLAASAFKRALAIDPNIRRDGFTLDHLYGPALMAKTTHIEKLAEWTLENSESADPYFLLGVTLAYDGQGDRAALFFERAQQLSGIADGHIAAFTSPTADDVARPDANAVLVGAGTEI